MEKSFLLSSENINLQDTPVLTLAFIGDGVHTLFIRKYMLEKKQILTARKLHKSCTKFCSAKGQATALNFIEPLLTEEETDIVRRARNIKNHECPKNSNIEEYKKATSFECLVGFLYAKKDEERLNNLLEIVMKNMEEVC